MIVSRFRPDCGRFLQGKCNQLPRVMNRPKAFKTKHQGLTISLTDLAVKASGEKEKKINNMAAAVTLVARLYITGTRDLALH